MDFQGSSFVGRGSLTNPGQKDCVAISEAGRVSLRPAPGAIGRAIVLEQAQRPGFGLNVFGVCLIVARKSPGPQERSVERALPCAPYHTGIPVRGSTLQMI